MSDGIVVLHVDDEQGFLELASTVLEDESDRLVVRTETNVDAALDRLDEESVDCVVSDFDMPETDGLEFLRSVRSAHGDLPFILFTGEGSERVASDAIAAGATDYLQKETAPEQFEVLANRVHNVVEQHRAERERRRNERRFEAVFEDPEMLVALLAPDGSLLQANSTAMELVDADHESLVGRPFWETPWWTDDLREDVREWVGRAADGEYVEYCDDYLRPGGHPRGAHGTFRPVTDADGEVVSLVVSAQDVTERMESERRFEAVLDSTVQFLALLAPDGRVLQTSERALAYGDLAPADVADAPLWAAPWFEPGETAATVERAVTRASDGDRFHGEVTVDAGEDRAVLDFSVTPVADERGEVALLVAEGNDVTDRERRERELQRHNERLDEFTSVVSHDLRGPLGVLRGSLDVAEETGDAEQFARCRRAADRMERTIEDLLELAREGDAVTDTAAVSLADVATASWDTADTGEATLRTAGDAALLADEHRLERLLANLYRNAVEHSEDAVTLTVGPTDEGFYVADDGPGIPPEEREQVFDSGYSTAEGGTGLGLPIVERIAEAHGWTVDVTDSEAGGARFEVGGVERTGE